MSLHFNLEVYYLVLPHSSMKLEHSWCLSLLSDANKIILFSDSNKKWWYFAINVHGVIKVLNSYTKPYTSIHNQGVYSWWQYIYIYSMGVGISPNWGVDVHPHKRYDCNKLAECNIKVFYIWLNTLTSSWGKWDNTKYMKSLYNFANYIFKNSVQLGELSILIQTFMTLVLIWCHYLWNILSWKKNSFAYQYVRCDERQIDAIFITLNTLNLELMVHCE